MPIPRARSGQPRQTRRRYARSAPDSAPRRDLEKRALLA